MHRASWGAWLGAWLALTAAPAFAGGLVTTSSPRSIGRAGTATVGDDGSGALLVNPAAIARRDGKRADIGLVFVDDEIAWQSASAGAPLARDQAPSSVAPCGAVFTTIGGWTLGLGAMTSSVSERSLRRPGDILDPATIGSEFDFRYAGIAGGVRRETVTAGVARRLGESFAVGLALGVSRVSVIEIRRVWAGFVDRNDQIGSAEQDLEMGFSGADRFTPSAVAGVLYVSQTTPIELGASIAWIDTARIDADVVAAGTRPRGPSTAPDNAKATLDYVHPITLRGGGRYVGDRFALELGADVARAPKSAVNREWTVRGMEVIDFTGFKTSLDRVPSRISLRTHGAVRGALDVELVAGFLWATIGYAHVVASVTSQKQSPTFGDLGGDTLGIGLEAKAGGFTFTLGWSRTWAARLGVQNAAFALDNPFGTGDRPIPPGVYDASIDQIGILIDAELVPGR